MAPMPPRALGVSHWRMVAGKLWGCLVATVVSSDHVSERRAEAVPGSEIPGVPSDAELVDA